eukprot:4728993-Amphidinium_carterae.1
METVENAFGWAQVSPLVRRSFLGAFGEEDGSLRDVACATDADVDSLLGGLQITPDGAAARALTVQEKAR